MTSRIPEPLAPYLGVPPDGSLDLVTGVLSATPNWLIIRYLVAALGESASHQRRPALDVENNIKSQDDVAVVLVSLMRDWTFWQTECKRAGGIDLAKFQQQNRLVFVDGMSQLFTPKQNINAALSTPPSGATATVAQSPRTGPLPSRGPPPSTPSTPSVTTQRQTPAPSHLLILDSPKLSDIQTKITSAISSLKAASTGCKVLLILDTPSLLLHSTTPPITAEQLSTSLLKLRSQVHAAIVSLPADRPFLQAAIDTDDDARRAASTPLDADLAAFTVNTAHQARVVIGCRELDTGWARDVSGVVRVTRGGMWEIDADESHSGEGEWLYHVMGDGGVKVWARGAA